MTYLPPSFAPALSFLFKSSLTVFQGADDTDAARWDERTERPTVNSSLPLKVSPDSSLT
jgi:hypothetical protein